MQKIEASLTKSKILFAESLFIAMEKNGFSLFKVKKEDPELFDCVMHELLLDGFAIFDVVDDDKEHLFSMVPFY